MDPNLFPASPPGRFLPGTGIEILHEDVERGGFRFVVFDFDGTISLIRAGWQGVMVPMMVEILKELRTGETDEELQSVVVDFVDRLTGKQTIYQMIQLAEEVSRRGGKPPDTLVYKHQYHDRLMEQIRDRREGLRGGALHPRDWVVPGTWPLLEALRERGLTLYLASGTDLQYVREEAGLLGVTDFFAGGIYGALDDYQNFSKAMIIEDILTTHQLRGSELLVFGDGFVEIENGKAVKGLAVGVATNEESRRGVNEWKRNRLIQAGADVIIPDFREHRQLLQYLWE